MKKCKKCYCRGDCGECKNTTEDLIHRERAIQAIKEIFPPPSETGAWNTALAVVVKAIEGLPSASNAGDEKEALKGNDRALTIGEPRGFQGRSISDGEFSGKGGWVD